MAGTVVPFFVMEFIPDAKSLIDFAVNHALPTRARVALFRKACEAVAHGHQKGFIHRDLKPGNIVVDAAGTPKVIDFGIARSTDADLALTTMHTDVGQLVGTLQYMSPEQFTADPGTLDVRADVYALGVVLYELLAGRPPYDIRRGAVFEAARVVQQVDPPPLSSVRRELRGDLATIVHKCLEKDREHRYASAAELAADLGRYLVGDPLPAAPVGFLGGVVRLARRHRVAAAAVATVFVALVASTLAIATLAVRAEREKALALTERDRASAQESLAQKERVRTQRLFDFLLDSIRSADPYTGRRDVTVLEMLSDAGKRAPAHFLDDPHLQSDMLQTIGQVLQFSGDYTAARPILEENVSLWRTEVAKGRDEGRDRLAGALQALSALYRSLHDYDRAAPLMEEAQGIAEQIHGPTDVRTAEFLGETAALAHERGDPKTAEQLNRRQLAIFLDSYGKHHEASVGALMAVDCSLASQGRFSDAERCFREAIEGYESLFEGPQPRIATANMHLGAALRLQRRWGEARPYLERALDMSERVLGKEHDITGEVLAHLGVTNAAEGRHEEALHAFEQVVAIHEKLFGPDSRSLLSPLHRLAAEYEALDRKADADRVRARATRLRDVTPPTP